jgi:hypothetical protein
MLTRASAHRFVPPIDEDQQREVADGWESVSLFNQGVHLGPQLSAGRSRKPRSISIYAPRATLSLPTRQLSDLKLELLTPCMPSRDPRHSAHHEPSRSRALHQSARAGAWWFAWLRRAELLRGCCAEGLQARAHRGERWDHFSLKRRLGYR